jgi:hypothetical protein
MECVTESLRIDDTILLVYTSNTTFGYVRKFAAAAYTNGDQERIDLDYGPTDLEKGLVIGKCTILGETK